MAGFRYSYRIMIFSRRRILEELFTGLDADILHVPGGHVGMIVQAENYLEKYIDKFFERIVSK